MSFRSMKPCWSCGAQNEPCFVGCECAKCAEPVAYEEWKQDNPEEYQDWLDRNTEDEDEDY